MLNVFTVVCYECGDTRVLLLLCVETSRHSLQFTDQVSYEWTNYQSPLMEGGYSKRGNSKKWVEKV